MRNFLKKLLVSSIGLSVVLGLNTNVSLANPIKTSYISTYYDYTFQDAVDKQLPKYSQTDLRGGWKKAYRIEIERYLNPSNFLQMTPNNGLEEDLVSIKILTEGLNVRSGAGTSHNIVTSVKEGQVYLVLDKSNDWYKINVNGKIGWVSGDHVRYTNGAPRDMYQFLILSGRSGISVDELNGELVGKGSLEGQGQAYYDAGQAYDINEVYLLSHSFLETGHGKSKLATGVLVSEVEGKPVEPKLVYNMFGIRAYDRDPLRMGSEYAYSQGWFTPADAIKGGAKWINDNYINNPSYKQNTLYKMKWNPVNPNIHQYATDIGWAYKQTVRMDIFADICDRLSSVRLRFDIPRYKKDQGSPYWRQADGDWYLIGSNGLMATGWQKVKSKWYYLGDIGTMQTGWQSVDGKWYYMNSAGIMQTGWINSGGNIFYMNGSGVMLRNTTIEGYKLGDNGVLIGQWKKENGSWYYYLKDNKATDWKQVDGKWYYFNKDGVMARGWQRIGNKWYYLNSSGAMQTGWQISGGRKYYMNSSGVMQTGWQKIADSWYYFNDNGDMASGWKLVDGKWYYMNSSGIMQKGWIELKGKKYYLDNSGAMAIGWKSLGGKWYYLQEDGSMARNTSIDGYTIDENGVWIR